jgi:hypothetical protein
METAMTRVSAFSPSPMETGPGLLVSTGIVWAISRVPPRVSRWPIRPRQSDEHVAAVGAYINFTQAILAGWQTLAQATGSLTASGNLAPSGTMYLPWIETTAGASTQRLSWTSPDIAPEPTTAEQIFETILALFLSHNQLRDRRIAERLTALYRDALDEQEPIRSDSIIQFKEFFLANKNVGFPRITLTPDGNLRVRWIQGEGSFVAIEFTGKPDAKLVAEISGLVPPMHFSSEPLTKIVEVARALGGSLE